MSMFQQARSKVLLESENDDMETAGTEASACKIAMYEFALCCVSSR